MAIVGQIAIEAVDRKSCILYRKSFLTGGVWCQMRIPMDAEGLKAWIQDPMRGSIQHALPNLNADQREFILTGMDGEAWDQMFNDRITRVDPLRN